MPHAPPSSATDPPPLECVPLGLCSWDYRVQGAAEGDALVRRATLTEQGTISLAGYTFDVRKHGWASGLWTLDYAGDEIARAKKGSILSSRFDLQADGVRYRLCRASWAGRTYHLYDGRLLCASIEPKHPLTRRAILRLPAAPALPVVLFSFWLAVLIWRRQSQASNSS